MRLLLFILFLFSSNYINAQAIRAGVVLDKETREPIIGAAVSDVETEKNVAITDNEGRFTLKKVINKIKISYLGYTSLTTPLTSDGVYLLQTEIKKLGEVVVTAQESKGLTTSSVIEKHAMEHLQPSSFADLLELLPGGRSHDPSFSSPNTIALREIATGSSNYATSSLGTSFMIDGAPISTNANMQYLSGAWDLQATSRDYVNYGVDMRSIATDDIEKVEIVRGIPSVEYGDLTSGLIKIERRKGGNDIQARVKADMSSKLFYAAKGFEWKERRLSLNISADYLNSKADPRNRLENYKRVTLSARLNKQWDKQHNILSLSTNIDYTGSFDNDKEDPDLNNNTEDNYKSSYNRYAFSSSFELKSKKTNSIFKILNATLSAAYDQDLIERTRFVQLSRLTVAPMSDTEGENDAFILPYKYTGHHEVDGKPFNAFAKLNAKFQIPSTILLNTLLVGADWSIDKNFGKGQVFDPTRPIYTGMATRQRKLSDIPANQRISFYAEETIKWQSGIGTFDIVAGIRATEMLNLPSVYKMHGRFYADPRANIEYTFPRFTLFGKPSFLRISGGLGLHTKTPTMEQLFPDKLYIDLVQLNYYHDNPDYRRINLMTYVRDTRNIQLKPARNKKTELSADLNIGGNRLSVTWFREKMTSGFRSQGYYESYHYKKYDTSGIDAASITAQPQLADLPYTEEDELMGYSNYTNGSLTLKEGFEYTFESVIVPVILTRFTINGAYFKTTYNNSIQDTYRPSQIIDGKQIQYVGLYNDNDGSVREMFNTNFTADTDVPKLRLGFSLSAQCLWFTTSKRKPVSNYPNQYIAPDGSIHDWQPEFENDTYLRWLVRNNTESLYEKQKVPFSMNLNFKVTKKLLNDRLYVAMFCNKLIDCTPSYKVHGATIRRHVTPYFGLEMNVKL
jgi:hypothetical protein